ncbi:calcitonin gene-related peptide type 1 receptor isoform X1 [Harpegnathos saltator]|uniref:calcitonin gene-related peptide type 1 receptor isoform X1 n=2 Tax=Harpegnathos saltator TaxID=610380 RepID=UPI000DBEE001|nr:calcitonin gene-related peptide type 1 receptor isoform X1 [Harpegnathos saltator]XP_025158207.1 calcitonin gene-related peptide type 1 receptor isoform X1 [Harpegnathos saltator]XP_025158208.1 calcitonin gene-related peptide type 1 receptor isoform X1 [Harpegnathos saltator]XP_025158209.1 calcitonin gene-related peptide type 1 receptor isoform X1 [Harpegnathos saltator]XP_025158210.1 calcitonin gene-related peptide type 1 receptor isoform X1 [Harpegnathos saltator]XP_025158211.1 calcitonin
METQSEMPGNTTVGSTLLDQELHRILMERREECWKLKDMNTTLPPEPYCPLTFDGWSCWPNTPAGSTVYTRCPNFITGFDASLMAYKYCDENGTWYRHPESNQIWSNYTTCVNLQDLSWQQKLNGIYEAGYAISLVALLLSLGILTYFRSLRCARITLHMNLFTSFALNNALWLIWYRFIVANTDVLINNDIPCRVLHVVLHYFLLTNYAWMLCEGFYLHTLLVNAFTSEHKLVNWLMGLGWSVPAVIVTLYTALRASSNDPADTEQCWINEGSYMSVLVYPVCVSTMLNLLFLFNIVRVLLMKLRAGPAIGTRPSRFMLQAFRATLLLVPLLGLHYLVIPFRPPKKHPWEQFYEVLSAITASFQGLCVAVLFCFCNGEVIAQFKRKWENSVPLRKRTNSYTATTVSVRWGRERRRCDYQPAASTMPEDCKLTDPMLTQHQEQQYQAVQMITTSRTSNHGNNNHAQVLVKRGDLDDKSDQTQC